jgi:hypothetical protein
MQYLHGNATSMKDDFSQWTVIRKSSERTSTVQSLSLRRQCQATNRQSSSGNVVLTDAWPGCYPNAHRDSTHDFKQCNNSKSRE